MHKRDAKGNLPFTFARERLTWCMTCGAFTGTHIKDLGRECSGTPGTGKIVVLRRISKRFQPVSGQFLVGSAERVCIDLLRGLDSSESPECVRCGRISS